MSSLDDGICSNAHCSSKRSSFRRQTVLRSLNLLILLSSFDTSSQTAPYRVLLSQPEQQLIDSIRYRLSSAHANAMAPVLFLETAHSLAKRDDDSLGSIPNWLLVFVIMIAAGVFVICVYGLARFMFPEKEGMRPVGAAQADYMRQVRSRTMDNLMEDYAPRGSYRQRQSNPR